MAMSDRTAAVAPYAQQLLYDQEVQAAIHRAAGATRDAYARSRGKSASEAARDKKLRRRLQQAVEAAWEVWSALGEPPRRKPRRRLRLIALVVGGAGVFLAVNPHTRQKALDVVGTKDASTVDPHQ
jgi:hypothetical protein